MKENSREQFSALVGASSAARTVRLLLVVAAGGGSRLGKGEPKALVSLAGRPILAWALEAGEGCGFARTVVTAPLDRVEDFERVAGAGVNVVA
ncbi:MAG: NTP transferase domain-containing protein, partial [Thermoanaerobaculia bacterium]